MAEIALHINNFQTKLQLLLKQYALLKKENEQLKELVKKQSNSITLLEKNIQHHQQKIAALQLKQSNLTEEEKKNVEKRINNYIKEIEHCLAMLNN
jgi:chromosome segregation ATPase